MLYLVSYGILRHSGHFLMYKFTSIVISTHF